MRYLLAQGSNSITYQIKKEIPMRLACTGIDPMEVSMNALDVPSRQFWVAMDSNLH